MFNGITHQSSSRNIRCMKIPKMEKSTTIFMKKQTLKCCQRNSRIFFRGIHICSVGPTYLAKKRDQEISVHSPLKKYIHSLTEDTVLFSVYHIGTLCTCACSPVLYSTVNDRELPPPLKKALFIQIFLSSRQMFCVNETHLVKAPLKLLAQKG